ncbi:MAG: hypothetical protein LCH85_01055 [Chloroflexi bacterium]|nr:hypothetical protein [Chloroflexota bacterium]
MPYELNQPVTQHGGTNQCWWLSMLDILRQKGVINQQVITRLLNNQPIPAIQGDDVYGPEWQRVIMDVLQNNQGWQIGPKTTVMVSNRPSQLQTMCNILGLRNIQFRKIMLVPSTCQDRFGELNIGDYVQVDKIVGVGTGHAMVGQVSRDSNGKKCIEFYNQQTGSRGIARLQPINDQLSAQPVPRGRSQAPVATRIQPTTRGRSQAPVATRIQPAPRGRSQAPARTQLPPRQVPARQGRSQTPTLFNLRTDRGTELNMLIVVS